MIKSRIKTSLMLTAVLALSTNSMAAALDTRDIQFPNSFVVADNEDDSTYMTTWTAYPIRIESYTGPNLNIPRSMLITLVAEGKASAFVGTLHWDCSEPKNTSIQSANDRTYIFDAIEQNIIPRTVARNLYTEFCQ